MIRYVHIGDQCDGRNEFALYNTVNDKFITLAGSQTWESLEECMEDLVCEQRTYGPRSVEQSNKTERERIRNLCQHHVPVPE